ncbi:MAG TPA: ribosome biogenesis GTP-binding protein YihA/YsxC [Dongiaceae bacterium]|nr:ribosome biogenesis GTP-binding protein YihA/YsxC [Dongiaceae bacterium]
MTIDTTLFAATCRFLAGAADTAALPPPSLPEIAFAGRSNVGKSSLLNALVGRRALAYVSAQPGRTQQLNFYELGEALRLVDLPGHGYARISRQESAKWFALITAYLRYRVPLKRIYLLADPKAGFKDSDRELMDVLDGAGLSYQIVLTKIDRLKSAEIEAAQAGILRDIARRPAAHPELHLTSAATGTGIAELRQHIVTLINGT